MDQMNWPYYRTAWLMKAYREAFVYCSRIKSKLKKNTHTHALHSKQLKAANSYSERERERKHQKLVDCLQFYPKHECRLSFLHCLRPAGEAFRHNCIAYFLGIPSTLPNTNPNYEVSPTNKPKRKKDKKANRPSGIGIGSS